MVSTTDPTESEKYTVANELDLTARFIQNVCELINKAIFVASSHHYALATSRQWWHLIPLSLMSGDWKREWRWLGPESGTRLMEGIDKGFYDRSMIEFQCG